GGQVIARGLAAGGELRGAACPCRTLDGRRLDLSVSLSLLRSRSGAVETAVAVIQDLTERRALEADLRRRQRLSAMGELASGVAHEVRNPLNAIAVIAQRLQREFRPVDGEAEYGQLTGTVRGEVDRVNRIVRQFLELARPPALDRRDTDLTRLLADTLRVAQSEARARRVQVEGDFEGLGAAPVDPEQLQQALLNLLVNAIDAAAPVEAQAPAGRVRLAGRRGAGEVELSVADSGPGIPASERERIFDLYYTTKAAGTGLGLSLVQRIVAEHGGRIDLDTAVGRGSTFTLRLPLSDPGAR
ncbi:MAG: ATP-binding protein, partial [Gemmatimonadota bacterium]